MNRQPSPTSAGPWLVLAAATLGVLLLGERLAPAGYVGVGCLIAGLALLVAPVRR